MSADAMATTADGIVTTKVRPGGANLFSSVYTLAWRAMLKIKHVPFQLFDVTFMPITFTLLFTAMFSGALESAVGDEYVQYLLPGIMVQTVIFITVYTGVGLNSDIQKGLFDRFKSLPIWQPSPIMGALTGDLFRYSVASLVILIVGLLLGFRPQAGPLGVIAAFGVVLLFAFALSWFWIIIAMLVKTPESVMTTSFIFLMPLTFASDIFVPLKTVKWEWLRIAVSHNPVSHVAGAARGLMHGTAAGVGLPRDELFNHIAWVFGTSALILLVAVPTAMRMYRRER